MAPEHHGVCPGSAQALDEGDQRGGTWVGRGMSFRMSPPRGQGHTWKPLAEEPSDSRLWLQVRRCGENMWQPPGEQLEHGGHLGPSRSAHAPNTCLECRRNCSTGPNAQRGW